MLNKEKMFGNPTLKINVLSFFISFSKMVDMSQAEPSRLTAILASLMVNHRKNVVFPVTMK